MSAIGKAETCLCVCWGTGALAGLAAFLRDAPEFLVLAAATLCAMLAVPVALTVARAVCPDPGMAPQAIVRMSPRRPRPLARMRRRGRQCVI